MFVDPEVEARPSTQLGDALLSIVPENTGPRLLTPRGGVAYSVRSPETVTFQSPGDFVAVLLAPVLGLETRMGDGKTHVSNAPAGSLIIIPANTQRSGSWSSTLESVTVGYGPGRLAELALKEFGLADMRLHPPPFGHVDDEILQMARLLRRELFEDAPNALFADSLILALGLHVIRRYSTAGGRGRLVKPAGGLPSAAAQRVQEFLDRNIAGKVTIAELAALCGLSNSHFIEAFSKTFGVPPYRYLLNLRLGLAGQLLVETELPIAEIAYLSGFSSQSHLTSTMSKYRRITPAQVRSGRKM